MWVDTGVLSGAHSPDANTDYRYVYQGSSVGFTTAQLLANDSDPQGQALTVVAVSEPSNDGVLTGSLVDGFIFTPAVRPALIGTDHQLNYLVTDTDGHVTQGAIMIRILAAGDTNRPPVARDDVARTNAASLVQVRVVGNDFDPDGDSFSVIEVVTPAHGTASIAAARDACQLHPRRRVLRFEIITYTFRDSHGLIVGRHVDGVGRHGCVVGCAFTGCEHRLPLRVSGVVGRVHGRSVARQRQRSAGSSVDGGGGVGTVQRRCADRVAGRRVHLLPGRCGRRWSAPIINSTISSPTPTVTSRRARS